VPELPYKIASLVYLFDARGRVLLLHRSRPPNLELYSPIGGKLEQAVGESPTACAQRELREEAGLELPIDRLHLAGIISETGYEDQVHWLMFLYEVIGPVEVARTEFDEGRLEWHDPGELGRLPLPRTDREVIWPLFWAHRGGFFAAHLDCRGGGLRWRVEQPASAGREGGWVSAAAAGSPGRG